MTADELIAFEADIAACFNRGEIRSPIHLDGGNEAQLIEVFSTIKRTDWVLTSWRSHYKALLHGVPPAEVKAAIMAGHSITMCFPEYRFFSSAIVGGTLPIGLGISLAIKRAAGSERVHCFIGEMTAATGIAHECGQYAASFNLPIRFIVEDNGLSVCTPTAKVWGDVVDTVSDVRFEYKLPHPHSGAGKRVQF